ncbi:MAG: sulfate ABC transporter substrate-binding protein [Acidobacteriota bacterium]
MKTRRIIGSFLVLIAILITAACLPGPPAENSGTQTITVYGFSIMKEALDKEIYPAFKAKWKREHGTDVEFASSFAGSETVVNQILQGAPADVAILSIDRDAQRLFDAKATTVDWHAYPNKGIINKTPFVILVRKGNPKGIQDFPDLGKPGIKLIHPDPVSSGGAQWSILAIYGSELQKSQAASGTHDTVKALNTLQAIWKNVISTPGSAREARTQFETGFGDALVTYELEGLLMKGANADIDVIIPRSTIFSEHPAVVIDRNVDAAKRPVVDAFLEYLWSDEAQKAFVKYHLRSVTNDSFNDENKEFAKIDQPFTVEMFGGWHKAYPDIIEKVFREQVQGKK